MSAIIEFAIARAAQAHPDISRTSSLDQVLGASEASIVRLLSMEFIRLVLLAGLIAASSIKGADSNKAGLMFELYAIFAVIVGGTALTGGRFTLVGSLIGVLTLTPYHYWRKTHSIHHATSGDLDRRGVDWKKFHDINFVDHLYKPFDASKWDTKPSGLLGPVTLVPKRTVDVVD